MDLVACNDTFGCSQIIANLDSPIDPGICWLYLFFFARDHELEPSRDLLGFRILLAKLV